MLDVSFGGAFLAGLISFLSPCVLPIVPPYLAYLAGISFTQLTQDGIATGTQKRIFLTALLFVLGFSTVFVMLGATASFLGQSIAMHFQTLSIIAGSLIIVMGLHFLGVFKIGFLYDLENETLIYANYPEARNTQFFGINDAGLIIARYTLENGTSDLTIYDSINENFIDLNISADTSEWDITDINNNGIVIANTEGVCPDNSSVLDPCGNTIHKYNINTGEHRQDSVLYLMTGLSNEALQLAGKVNHRVSPFTGKGESTGLLATPK